ncbi:type III secretion effector protein [Pseudomonas sp. NIBRBAC000502773]|uniref:Type III secretion effector protein n=2 Tax=Pseudomonas fluorescens group TaxID=136843 RepID=A0A7Z6MSS0_PSEFL|nr:type III secretion effector protein [Pseudomonas sp. NIBRBAC000502773]RDS87615.1 type III secretion effector protein [Pseudomonas fluorescens]
MKAFVGQHKFQAPVAGDFFRGLPVEEKSSHDNTTALKNAGLLNGLTAWWRKQKLG